MLSLKDMFDSIVAPEHAAPPEQVERQLRLASAVLLVEVMRSDGKVEPAELQAVLGALQTRFSLSKDEADRLVELARQTSRGATDYFTFTSRINDSFSMEQKIRMVENMWKVAYADGVLSAPENHVMHKISELLYIPHGAYIAAKLRAKAAAGLT